MATDLSKRIVYQNDAGGVSVIVPFYAGGYRVDDAVKDIPPIRTLVPNGQHDIDESGNAVPLGEVVLTARPYKIVDVADIPSDRSERNAWTVDPADLTDGAHA